MENEVDGQENRTNDFQEGPDSVRSVANVAVGEGLLNLVAVLLVIVLQTDDIFIVQGVFHEEVVKFVHPRFHFEDPGRY